MTLQYAPPYTFNIENMEMAGYFGVDSGMAMVGDPAYIDDWDTNKNEAFPNDDDLYQMIGKYSFHGAGATTLNKDYGELGIMRSVVFGTGSGDGLYPVYISYNDEGNISKVVIDFERYVNKDVDKDVDSDDTTDYFNRCAILGDLYFNYKHEKDFKDFIARNDVGLPLAYLVGEELCEANDTGENYINETWTLFLASIELEDVGFETLQDVFVAAEESKK